MSNNIQTEISIPRKTAELYIQANREIEKRLGQAPGAEVLMSIIVEHESPAELVEDYCRILLEKP